MPFNVYLAEANEQVSQISSIVSALKKKLNVCALSKFRSADECAEFYQGFFANMVETNSDLTFSDWYNVYIQLFSHPEFSKKLVMFITMYQPNMYNTIFNPLLNAIKTEEVDTAKSNLRLFYSDVRAKLNQLRSMFDAVCQNAMTNSVIGPNAVQFCKAVSGKLTDIYTYICRAQENMILATDSAGDGIARTVHGYPMREDAEEVVDECVAEVREFVSLLESFDFNVALNEDVADKLSDLKDSAEYKALVVEDKAVHGAERISKALDTFDRKISGWINKFRAYRKERQIKAMLGESHHVLREILRITGAIVASGIGSAKVNKLFGSLIGIVIYIISMVITSKMAANDMKKYIDMLTDELEIIEKKIEHAERKGDDKGVIQLIRLRQKMQHQLEELRKKVYPVTGGKQVTPQYSF